MALTSDLARELNQLGYAPATLSVGCPAGQLEAEITQLDSLGLEFDRLELTTDRLAQATPARLKKLGEDLSARLTYLVEPISPIELDSQGATLQLRSNPPQKDDDGANYFELLIRRGGSLALCRYRKEPGTARHPISATVTREVFLRLAGDFEAVL